LAAAWFDLSRYVRLSAMMEIAVVMELIAEVLPVGPMAEPEIKDWRSNHDRRGTDRHVGLDIHRSRLNIYRRRGPDYHLRRHGKADAKVETDTGLRGCYSPE